MFAPYFYHQMHSPGNEDSHFGEKPIILLLVNFFLLNLNQKSFKRVESHEPMFSVTTLRQTSVENLGQSLALELLQIEQCSVDGAKVILNHARFVEIIFDVFARNMTRNGFHQRGADISAQVAILAVQLKLVAQKHVQN